MKTESFCHGLSNILLTNKIKVMGDQMQDDEMFGGEWKKEMNQYSKAAILESFAVIGTKAEHSRQLLGKTERAIRDLRDSFMRNYAYIDGAEFDYIMEIVNEIEIHLKIT